MDGLGALPIPAYDPLHSRRPAMEDVKRLRALADAPGTSWLLVEGTKGAGVVAEVRAAGIPFPVRAHRETSDRRCLWLLTLGGRAGDPMARPEALP